MRQVGYLTFTRDGYVGERGEYYDYVMARNGVFIESEGKFMAARVPVAECVIRGLAELPPQVVLRYGKIPSSFFDLAVSEQMKDTTRERYVAITCGVPQNPVATGYHIHVPDQEDERAHITYTNPERVVVDLHSHPTFDGVFSYEDDLDEQSMRIYVVTARLTTDPTVRVRVGVYGYMIDIPWSDVFEGELSGFKDCMAEPAQLMEPSYEMRLRDAIQDLRETMLPGLEYPCGRLVAKATVGHDHPPRRSLFDRILMRNKGGDK